MLCYFCYFFFYFLLFYLLLGQSVIRNYDTNIYWFSSHFSFEFVICIEICQFDFFFLLFSINKSPNHLQRSYKRIYFVCYSYLRDCKRKNVEKKNSSSFWMGWQIFFWVCVWNRKQLNWLFFSYQLKLIEWEKEICNWGHYYSHMQHVDSNSFEFRLWRKKKCRGAYLLKYAHLKPNFTYVIMKSVCQKQSQ